MKALNRMTLVFSFFIYSFMLSVLESAGVGTQIISIVIFWFTYFWWFDSAYITRAEHEKILQQNKPF